jgi:hypothetical protein
MMALVLMILSLRKENESQVHLEECKNINDKHNYPFSDRVMIGFVVNITI